MRVYGKRALLNLPGHHSTAAVVAELRQNECGWSAHLDFSDCRDVVNLELCSPATASEEEFENDMHKLDTILDAVHELQKGMRRVRRSYR